MVVWKPAVNLNQLFAERERKKKRHQVAKRDITALMQLIVMQENTNMV